MYVRNNIRQPSELFWSPSPVACDNLDLVIFVGRKKTWPESDPKPEQELQ